jgi:hypothetical protein
MLSRHCTVYVIVLSTVTALFTGTTLTLHRLLLCFVLFCRQEWQQGEPPGSLADK